MEAKTEVKPVDIRRAAMDLLARREHSCLELRQKLQRRFSVDSSLIEIEIEKLTEQGLQSDSRLAEAYLRARANRGQGPVKIGFELRSKGVSDQVIALAFQESDIDWFELAVHVSSRKFGTSAPVDLKERARRANFLRQRGFNFEHIAEINDSMMQQNPA